MTQLLKTTDLVVNWFLKIICDLVVSCGNYFLSTKAQHIIIQK